MAREVEGALPIELTAVKDKVQLVKEFVSSNFVEYGMCADIAIHDKNDGNPHFHCLLTTRNVNNDGFGNKNRDWDKREHLETWRREWANIQNRELERRGLEVISHESYAVQDFGRLIEREPTIHLGSRINIWNDTQKLIVVMKTALLWKETYSARINVSFNVNKAVVGDILTAG